ncbi:MULTISPECIES: UdgX family uracil-DNA binding protein [Amycolatopsis]|uniref:Type-4 uracil-DNA glycosylase n=1 Tax=Amycolatopsis tucumanensis TaxID=401106 RepID=A0ABP7II76_9PSEU|nr:UdgX family uracil-DNA binding protein [Amycolatopsis tucumanensis]MCF6424488.1 UdgX family uracil-DNA binding protein [Amycolatopsis tucumanensis]
MATKTQRTAAEFVPDSRSLDRLRSAALGCQGCDLYRDATQTVFGDGPAPAKVMMLGEQPGDREDVAGEPFVGPAGRLLDRALEEAGVDRSQVYVTNAVKHFKFVRADRGKQRIHKKPSRGEIVACRPWLVAELEAVQPSVVVLLGATAASSLMGPSFRVTAHRGELLPAPEEFSGRPERVLPTVHPSSVLRAPDRDEAFAALVKDLRAVPSVM